VFNKGVVPAEQWISLIDAGTPPTLAMALLLGYLDDRLEREPMPILEMPARVPDWAEAWLNGWEVPHHDAPAEARAATMLRMLSDLPRSSAAWWLHCPNPLTSAHWSMPMWKAATLG
jgi:hypothetical protein